MHRLDCTIREQCTIKRETLFWATKCCQITYAPPGFFEISEITRILKFVIKKITLITSKIL